MPNRTICEVLDEMKAACKTLNFSYLPGLIEEIQSMANRMEAALGDQHDLDWARKEYKKLKKEIESMREVVDEKKDV